MDLGQYKKHIFNPAFTAMAAPYDSPEARQICLATILHESLGLEYISQLGSGYARGFGQCEPPTYDDIWRYLSEDRPGPRAALKMMMRVNGLIGIVPDIDRLYYDLRYQICMVRMRYWMIPESLPVIGDVMGVMRYWSKYYQTSQDPAKEQTFVQNWAQQLGADLV